jgi:hypothetical protein
MKIKISMSSTGPYEYALVNRPAGIGCCPKDFIGVEERPKSGQDHYDMARHGSVVYDRKLTDAETKNFELAYMANGKDREDLALAVARKLQKYASGYIDMYAEDKVTFVYTVQQTLKRISLGYVPSVGPIDKFADQVYHELKSM